MNGGSAMQSIENRLMKLETAQQAIRKPYSDAERAIRVMYLLEQGGETAAKIKAIFARVTTSH